MMVTDPSASATATQHQPQKLPEQIFTPFKPLMSEEEKKAAEEAERDDRPPSPSAEEKGINEIESM